MIWCVFSFICELLVWNFASCLRSDFVHRATKVSLRLRYYLTCSNSNHQQNMICDHFATLYNILQRNNSKHTTLTPLLHSPNLPLEASLKYFCTWRHDFFRIVEYNYRIFLACTWCTDNLLDVLDHLLYFCERNVRKVLSESGLIHDLIVSVWIKIPRNFPELNKSTRRKIPVFALVNHSVSIQTFDLIAKRHSWRNITVKIFSETQSG